MILLNFLVPIVYSDVIIAPLLPKETIQEQFRHCKSAFEQRWDLFRKDRAFIPYKTGRSDEALEKEFLTLKTERKKIWFCNPDAALKESRPGYEVSQSLFYQDGARYRNCIAFSYNNTIPYFNASTMSFSNRFAIACEGAREKDVTQFFSLLVGHRVTHLVRLTGDVEGEYEKCHPYWKGLLDQEANGEWTMRVPLDAKTTYKLHYYIEEDWKDNHGVDSSQLLALVKKVKNSLDEVGGLLTVHCSAGVGRTGTFLAALAIVDAIDRKEPFSIEEIVYRLSLQRFNSVSMAQQYITLHRLAEEYLK